MTSKTPLMIASTSCRTSLSVISIAMSSISSSSGSSSGASEMLRLQLELFDEISGTTGALRGKSSHATGAEMLHTELENGTISMLDMLASFRAFIDERNARLRCVNSDINRNNCQEL
jgi:hypothetical protein